MFKRTTSFDQYNLLHWFWLWILAAIAITALQRTASGQPVTSKPPTLPGFEYRDNLDEFRPRHELHDQLGTLRDVLERNRRGDHEAAVEIWKRISLHGQSKTWQQVGLGVAHLRMGNIDDAHSHLTKATELDRTNAVAEYFLGRLFQAKSRRVPFWYQMNSENPFRYASFDTSKLGNPSESGSRTRPRHPESQLQRDRLDSKPGQGKTYLPHSRRYDFDLKARQHFRRTVELATCCDLDQPIRVRQPVVQLASHHSGPGVTRGFDSVTVRDLLISLGEEDFAEKALREIAGRLASSHTPQLHSTPSSQAIRLENRVATGGGTPFVLSSMNRQARQCLRRFPGDQLESKRCSV